MMNTKHCPACEAQLPASAFSRNASRPDGLQSTCKSCRKAARKPRPRTSELGQLDDALKADLQAMRQARAEADAREDAEIAELAKTDPALAEVRRGWAEYERQTRFW